MTNSIEWKPRYAQGVKRVYTSTNGITRGSIATAEGPGRVINIHPAPPLPFPSPPPPALVGRESFMENPPWDPRHHNVGTGDCRRTIFLRQNAPGKRYIRRDDDSWWHYSPPRGVPASRAWVTPRGLRTKALAASKSRPLSQRDLEGSGLGRKALEAVQHSRSSRSLYRFERNTARADAERRARTAGPEQTAMDMSTWPFDGRY